MTTSAPVSAPAGPATSPTPRAGLAVLPGPVTPDAASTEFPTPGRSRSPQLLRRLQVVVALALLVAGALAAWAIADLRSDLSSAPELAQQYARLGQVRHEVHAAADLAARSVLSGETADGKLAHAADDRLAAAAELLVDAARARPQDARILTELNRGVVRYAQLLFGAAGAPRTEALAALGAADGRLDGLLDDLDAAQEGLAEEATSRPLSQNTALTIWPALALLGVVVWVGWVVARLSHRVVNPGLAGAALALVGVLVVAVAAQGTAAGASDDSRDREFTHVLTITGAIDGLDQAQRVLTRAVLRRSWTGEQQKAYTAAISRSLDAAKAEDLPSLTAFGNTKDDLVKRFSAADWAGATNLLLTDDTSPEGAAAGFRENATQRAQQAVADAAAATESGRSLLVVQMGLAVALALAGAALGVLGLARRLQEYR